MGEKQNGQEWNLSIFYLSFKLFLVTLFSFSNCHYYHFSHPTKVPKNLQWKRKVPNWLIKKVPVVKTTMIHATTKSSYYYFKNISDCNILILISNINPPMHEKTKWCVLLYAKIQEKYIHDFSAVKTQWGLKLCWCLLRLK